MKHSSLELMAQFHKATECYQQPDVEKHAEGFHFLLEAAENGMTQACKTLGLLYMNGQYAPYPEKDEPLAARWWRMAAENGDEEAMFWLGQCYEDGIGVEVNEEEAQIWKKFAIANGFVAEGDEEEEAPAEPEKTAKIASEKSIRKSRKKEETKPKKRSMAEKKDEKAAEKQTAKKTDRNFIHIPAHVVENVNKKRNYQLREVPKNKEEEEVEAARFAREEEEARRISNQYRARMGIGGAICCVLLLWIALLIIYWFVREPMKAYPSLFWILAGLVSIPVVLSGYGIGVKKAQRRVEMVAEYRKTPFYHAYGCELGQMTPQQQWCYKIYRSLAKNYYPVTYRKKLDLPELRGYRGCLYTNWVYQCGNEKAQPEFVILTEKAVYVVRTAYFTGRIQGDLMDTGWSLFSDGEKDLTAQRISNLADENARNIRIIKEDLVQYFDLPLEQVPFFNVIFLNQEVDIKGLRRMGAEDDTIFVQGLSDKLRGCLGVWESRLPTHNLGLDELTFAFEQIGRQFVKRSGW